MGLRIGMINPSPGPRFETGKLGYYLAKRGHEIHYYVPSKTVAERDVWNGFDVTFFRCRFLPIIRYPLPALSWEWIVRKDLHHRDFDIVQACDYDYLTSLIPLIRGGIPFSRLLLTTDAFPGFGWRYGMRSVDIAAKLYTRSLGKMILKSYSRVVLLHERLVPIAMSLGVPQDRISVIHNGVDTNLFKRVASAQNAKKMLGIESDNQVILCVGRLSRVKGIDDFLRAAVLVQKRMSKAKFFIVGSGEEEGRLLGMASNLNVDCQFLGHIAQTNLPRWYSAADVFVSPSRSEGVPNTLLEAAAVGAPIVSTEVGGVPTLITNEVNGLLVPPESPSQLAKGILRILSDPDKAKDFAEEALKTVLRQHSWETAVKLYERVYEGMCRA